MEAPLSTGRLPWASPDRTEIWEDEAVRLVPLDVDRDGGALWAATLGGPPGFDLFRYQLATGPFPDEASFRVYLRAKAGRSSEVTYTVVRKKTGLPVGLLSLLNIRPDHGVIEVGSIWYGPSAQRSEVNTHALFLVMTQVFDHLGYRRLEWKCHSENRPSREAALRLGFRFEGTFRQHFWDKGANRDTAWYALVDGEWPSVKQRFVTTLLAGPRNPDPVGSPTPGPRTYLPLFYDLTGKRVLVVGGGKAAWQKVRALAPFTTAVTVVSPAFEPDLEARAAEPGTELVLVRRRWAEADLDVGIGLVLACTDDQVVNGRVVAASRARGLPVLDAARPGQGDFIQPAARKTGSYTLAVSSGGRGIPGAGPKGAVAVRDALAGAFDEAVERASRP